MVSYVTRMPAGIAGAISRADSSTVEAIQNDSSFPVLAYGAPYKVVSGKARSIASGDTASAVAGFIVRPFPVQSVTNAFGPAAPDTSGILDAMRRGYMSVVLKGAVPAAKNAPVFILVATRAGLNIGDIVASAVASDAVAINAVFQGPADSTGITEISINI